MNRGRKHIFTFIGPNVNRICHVEWNVPRQKWVAKSGDYHATGDTPHDAALHCFDRIFVVAP